MNREQGSVKAGREFSVGVVIRRTYLILKKAPGPFCALSLIGFIPGVLLEAAMPQVPFEGEITLIWLVRLFSYLAVVLYAGSLCQGAAALGVLHLLRGETVSVSRCLKDCSAFLGPLTLLFLVTFTATFLGLQLLVVPGLVLWSLWAVTVQVCVVEGTGLKETLERSAALTRGNRLRIFGLLLLVVVGSTLLSEGVGALFNIEGQWPLLILAVKSLALVIPEAF